MYADDITVFLSDNISFRHLLNTLQNFRKESSLSINISKTKAMWIGAFKDNQHSLENIQFENSLTILGVDIAYSPNVFSSQLQRTLEKIRVQLNLWKARHLSLIGKIQIVKTFAFSQLLYLASLSKIPDYYIKEVNKLVFGFIWNGPDRIKREILVKQYEDGGLKMICSKSLLQVQKVKWIQRVFTSNSKGWKIILLTLLQNVGGDFIFHCNYDLNILNLTIPEWYKDVMISWSTVFQKNIKICDQILWNNRCILQNGKSFYKPEIKNKGFVKVSHMLDEYGRPLRWKDAKDKGLTFVEYFLLLDCYKFMPSRWKSFFLSQNFHPNVDNISLIPTLTIDGITREVTGVPKYIFYTFFMEENNPSISNIFTRLKDTYGFQQEEVRELLKLPLRITIDTRLRALQFNILNNLITTKVWIFRIKKVTDTLCTFCKVSPESLVHLFYSCHVVNQFWNNVGTLFASLDLPDFLSESYVLFGICKPQIPRNIFILNFLLLSGKQYIFRCRCDETKPTLSHFCNFLLSFETVEHTIAQRKCKLGKHDGKWAIILNTLKRR